MNTKILGNRGEDAAASFLERHGLSVLERNFRVKTGEIDIIARDGRTLVFVEVKTRRTEAYGRPGAAVGFRKQQKIIECARWYLRQRQIESCPCRFDVIEVLAGEGHARIRHIKGAFECSS